MGRCAHRHDFEELFRLPEGSLSSPSADANRSRRVDRQYSGQRPQMFKNSRKDGAYALPVRAGGQDEFFLAVGFPVASRAQASDEEIAEKRKLLATLLPKYRTEMVAP